jgi:hypothetical protein
MQLHEAKKIISDGDVVFVFPNRTSSFIDKAISWWEGPHTPFHCGLLVWQIQHGIPQLMVCQMTPDHKNLVSINDYVGNRMHIVKRPDGLKIDGMSLISRVSTINYSIEGALASGLDQYLPFVPVFKSRKKKFCSQYVADVYNHQGFEPFIPDWLDPFNLEQFLLKAGLGKLEIDAQV